MARRKRRYKRNAAPKLVSAIEKALGELEEEVYLSLPHDPEESGGLTRQEYALLRKLRQIETSLDIALKLARTL